MLVMLGGTLCLSVLVTLMIPLFGGRELELESRVLVKEVVMGMFGGFMVLMGRRVRGKGDD